jgi:hypothetical protein
MYFPFTAWKNSLAFVGRVNILTSGMVFGPLARYCDNPLGLWICLGSSSDSLDVLDDRTWRGRRNGD